MASASLGPGSCKRRLTWPDSWGSQEEDEAVCGAGKAAGCGLDAADGQEPASPQLDSPLLEAEAAAQQDPPYMMQSPIIDRAMFLNGRRKARVLFSPQQQEQEQPLVGEEEDPRSPEPQRPAPQPEQQPGGAYGVPPCPRQLSAAVSSSRASLDVLFRGIAGAQLLAAATAAGSPATPAIAAAAPLPAPPRKDSPSSNVQLPAGRLQRTCRAARALPGLAPCGEAGLCEVRAWLSALKAR